MGARWPREAPGAASTITSADKPALYPRHSNRIGENMVAPIHEFLVLGRAIDRLTAGTVVHSCSVLRACFALSAGPVRGPSPGTPLVHQPDVARFPSTEEKQGRAILPAGRAFLIPRQDWSVSP